MVAAAQPVWFPGFSLDDLHACLSELGFVTHPVGRWQEAMRDSFAVVDDEAANPWNQPLAWSAKAVEKRPIQEYLCVFVLFKRLTGDRTPLFPGGNIERFMASLYQPDLSPITFQQFQDWAAGARV